MSFEKRIDKKSGKVSWVTRVYVGKDSEGKKKYTNESFDTRAEAKALDDKYRSFKKNTIFDKSVSSKTLVDVVWSRYIIKLAETVKDNTILSYQNKYDVWLKPELGSFQIGNINLITISNLKQRLRERKASEYMQAYCLIVLKGLLNYAATGMSKYIIENPMNYYDIPSLNSFSEADDEIKYLNRTEANKFFEVAMGCRDYLLMVLMVNTGLRTNEAAALRPSDFNFELGTVSVNGNITLYSPKENEPKFDETYYVYSSPKSWEKRTIRMSPMALEAAKLLLARHQGNYFLVSSAQGIKQKIILKRGADPKIIEASFHNNRSLNNVIARICKIAEVTDIGPHGLRHTFAANYLMNGGTLHSLSKILGHKSITSTEIYAHLSPEYLGDASSVVNFGATEEFKRNSDELKLKVRNM